MVLVAKYQVAEVGISQLTLQKKHRCNKFPENEDLKQRWIKAIPRKNWTPTTSHKVCAKHFDKNDFITTLLDHKESCNLNLLEILKN